MTHESASDSSNSSRKRVPQGRRKKRSKPSLTPQSAIDNIWKCFSSLRPLQALSILPSDPTTRPSSDGSYRNELLSKGRLHAVTECREKVSEIIRECRQLNMRYRDRDWDLVSLQNLLSMRDPFQVIDPQMQAFDLADKGHCLNGLRNTAFDLSEISHLDVGSNSPGAVRRVHEIFPYPTFMRKVDGKDVSRGSSATAGSSQA